MGRYTSVQTFSDENTKVVSGYAGAGQQASSDGKADGGGQPESYKRQRLETEKIIVTSGSCAGAGSSEFDIYRAARRRENIRVETMEKQDEEARRIKEFEDRIARNKREADERTAKNAEKRQKKKEKQKMHKQQANAGSMHPAGAAGCNDNIGVEDDAKAEAV